MLTGRTGVWPRRTTPDREGVSLVRRCLETFWLLLGSKADRDLHHTRQPGRTTILHASNRFTRFTGALVALAAALVLSPEASSAQDAIDASLPTDSVTGTVVERFAEGFLLRSDEGEEYAFEILPDTVQERRASPADSAERGATAVPHATVMESRDIRFVLQQLDASDERDRMHVHYVTLGDVEPRRIAIWVSISQDRVPGGG